MKPKYNTENLKNIHHYHTELQKQIDDADWLGEYDTTEHLRSELEHVKVCIDNGDTYYPNF